MDLDELARKLKAGNAVFRVVHHKPVFNMREACDVLGTTPDKDVKNLLFRDEKDFVLVVVRGDRKVDTDAVANARGVPKVALAKPDEVLKITGVPIGSVNLFSAPAVLIDEEVKSLPEINVHPDDNSVTVFIKSDDALRLVPKAVFGRFSK